MFFDRFTGAGYVCAHRGARSLAPENTMLAAHRALEVGADYWETDVHVVADGTLMVFHDDVLTRTTDVADRPEFADRAPWPIHAFTADELRTLDAGSWFIASDPFGTIAAGDISREQLEPMRNRRIPTLAEALAFTRDNDFPMNLEVKDQQQAPGDLSIVSAVLKAIREADAEDLVLISSFNHTYLAEMRRIAPNLPVAALTEERHPDAVAAYLKELGAAGYHPDHALTSGDLVRDLTAEGFRVTPYTVNDMDRAAELLDAGCFAITTDFPQSLRQRLSGR